MFLNTSGGSVRRLAYSLVNNAWESRYVENATFPCRPYRYTFPIVGGTDDIFLHCSLRFYLARCASTDKRTRDNVSLAVETTPTCVITKLLGNAICQIFHHYPLRIFRKTLSYNFYYLYSSKNYYLNNYTYMIPGMSRLIVFSIWISSMQFCVSCIHLYDHRSERKYFCAKDIYFNCNTLLIWLKNNTYL